MKTQIRFDFINKYKNKPILVKAPGRINIIGEHTDYNMGYVLPAAIGQSIFFAVHSNLSNKISIVYHVENRHCLQIKCQSYISESSS